MSSLTDVFTAAETSGARSAQPSDVRRQNISAVMRTVLGHGPIARADVARLTGLAPGSVTKLTARLVEAGLLREESSEPAARVPGRPRVPVSIDPGHHVVGVHVGLLWTIVGVIDLTGRIVSEVTMQHDGKTSFDVVARQAIDQVKRQTRNLRGTVLGVGASTGGWVDPDSGHVIDHPVLGWRDAPLRDTFEERLGHPVRVDNTVRAIALAESWFGAGRDVRTLLHLFVGNIVGAGVVTDGRQHRGPRSASGYLDHLPVGVRTDRKCSCGRYDCLQAVASDVALVTDARQRGILGPGENLDDLARLAAGGDRRATAALRARARHVGYALALLIEILNPERVVLGGGVADHPEYLPEVHDALRKRMHRPLHTDPSDLVRPTSFGRHAVMLASGTLFLDAYYRDPMAFPPLAAAQ
ncbi:MAG: ROK family transcriptional regulator [Micromonosporaceae bacterium]